MTETDVSAPSLAEISQTIPLIGQNQNGSLKYFTLSTNVVEELVGVFYEHGTRLTGLAGCLEVVVGFIREFLVE